MLVVTKRPNKGAIQSDSKHKKREASQDASQSPQTDAAQDSSKSLEKVRADKVLDIRRQLAEGRYDVNRAMNAVCDRILEGLLG